MYALELFFGSELNQYVKNSWQQLKDLHITSTMLNIQDLRPHITVAVYDQIEDLESYGKQLEEHMSEQKKFTVSFDSIATFPSTNTVFAAPTMTSELFHLHRNYYEAFQAYSKTAHAHYTPDRWNTHCTLAMHLTKLQMTRAVACCVNHFKPFQSSIESIGLVHLQYDGGSCISSPTIKEVAFQQIK